MQRLRLTFSMGEELKYISHLDLMRLWQRALRRADIPVVYSQGFSPHPRLSLAAPLAIGVSSSGELMDLFLERRVSPHFFIKTISKQLPRGIDISEVAEVGLGLPSLQSQVRSAEYNVAVEVDQGKKEIEDGLSSLLGKGSLPWQHARDREIRKYDLRALIDDLWIIDWCPLECTLGMRLRCDNAGTGRPEQVVSALGFANPPKSIHRTKLILARNNKHVPRR
ncbi:MAG: TIGR03936 family radical SAM-associated protein [Dehalococcoidia bacterium]